ncbi:MAG: hypothetical protein KatS3mg027_1174 [Bacteroidia bacterium]|nr:MAG: hypothetical protein KatS3mg027_1174 [Bacteroidia bacterium]
MKKSIIKIYLFHFFAAILLLFFFLYGITLYLNSYTNHNQYISTPNVLHLPLSKAQQLILSKKLRYTIIDSIYKPEEEPGIVIAQNPEPNTPVKENRNIYLTITSFQPPSIEMPKLVDLSERQAIMILKSYELKLGKIIYEPSYCNGCVVKQLYNKQEIPPGKYIKKGSKIDLIIGQKNNLNTTTDSSTINTSTNSLNDTEFE